MRKIIRLAVLVQIGGEKKAGSRAGKQRAEPSVFVVPASAGEDCINAELQTDMVDPGESTDGTGQAIFVPAAKSDLGLNQPTSL
jgi:hypothetical protein